jgi:hypothetical protein
MIQAHVCCTCVGGDPQVAAACRILAPAVMKRPPTANGFILRQISASRALTQISCVYVCACIFEKFLHLASHYPATERTTTERNVKERSRKIANGQQRVSYRRRSPPVSGHSRAVADLQSDEDRAAMAAAAMSTYCNKENRPSRQHSVTKMQDCISAV